jgi:hypothetical protein
MNDHEKHLLLEVNPDFILLKRFDYSLTLAMLRYPDGMPLNLIAQALNLTENQVDRRYRSIIGRLRAKLVE